MLTGEAEWWDQLVLLQTWSVGCRQQVELSCDVSACICAAAHMWDTWTFTEVCVWQDSSSSCQPQSDRFMAFVSGCTSHCKTRTRGARLPATIVLLGCGVADISLSLSVSLYRSWVVLQCCAGCGCLRSHESVFTQARTIYRIMAFMWFCGEHRITNSSSKVGLNTET